MKCTYCGAKFKLNENMETLVGVIPDSSLEKVKYIPSCNCAEELKQKELSARAAEDDRISKINRAKRYKEISIIDSKFEKSHFEDADMNLKHMKLAERYASSFARKGTLDEGLFFTGNVGTGKTFASSCIANHLMDNGQSVFVIQLALYINKIQREWAEAEHQILKAIEDCDLLVIDDFGVEKVTEFTKEKIFNLIDKRYRLEKPVVITSNLTLDEVEKDFGARIADRIKEMTFEITVTGKSQRKKVTIEDFLKEIA